MPVGPDLCLNNALITNEVELVAKIAGMIVGGAIIGKYKIEDAAEMAYEILDEVLKLRARR